MGLFDDEEEEEESVEELLSRVRSPEIMTGFRCSRLSTDWASCVKKVQSLSW